MEITSSPDTGWDWNLSLPQDSIASNITQDEIDFHWSFYKVTVPILFCSIIAVGLTGNLLVVFVILSKKKMRNTVNLLLLNLAISDILFLTLSVPFVIYHYAANNWDIAEFFCKLWQFVLYVTVYITVYTLVAISVVRYFTIVISPRSVYFRTNKNVILLILLLWLVMLLVNIPILYSYRIKEYHFGYIYRYCAVDNGRLVHITFFTFSYIIPFILIVTFYSLLMRFLKGNRKRSSLRQSNRSTTSEQRGRYRTTFASRIVLVVVAIFGLSWFPLHMSLLWAHYGSIPETRAYQIFRVLCQCLAYANSCMNPIIYNYVSKDFRKRFHAIWSPCCGLGLQRHASGSHVLTTYEFKDNGTCNGRNNSIARRDSASKQCKPKPAFQDVVVDSPACAEHVRSSNGDRELLCNATTRNLNNILVTDL